MFQNPPKELTSSPSNKVEPDEKQPVFWFKKKSGEVFCAQEQEAWGLINGRSKVRNKSLEVEYMGRSDGSLYFEGLKEMRQIFKQKGLEAAQEFLRELQDMEFQMADKSIIPRNMDYRGDPAAIQELIGKKPVI